MEINNERLIDVAFDVCQTMLGMKILERPVDAPTSTAELSAAISISGDHNAIVEVSTCLTAGRWLTSAMFDVDAESTSMEEIADAISEVANIIGGNIKGMFGGECALSLPRFSDEPTTQLSEGLHEVSFDLCGGIMNVVYRPLNPELSEELNTNDSVSSQP